MSEPVWVPLGAAPQPGEVELAYVQGTASLGISGTSEAAASEYLVLPPLTFDGNTPIIVEAYVHSFSSPSGANASMLVNLWDGSTDLGRLLRMTCPGGGAAVTTSLLGRRRLTPSAGAHVFRLKAWVTTGGGTIDGVLPSLPYYLRVVAPTGVPLVTGLVTGAVPLLTALPTTPLDGQEIILTDSLTAPTYTWHLKYVAAKASNKWVFVGGSPISSQVDANQATTSSTYANLSTVGPSIVVPVAGEYTLEHGFMENSSTTGNNLYMSYDIGATPANDLDSIVLRTTGGSNGDVGRGNYRQTRRTLAAVTLVAKYKVFSGDGQFMNRWMRLTPVAIGG